MKMLLLLGFIFIGTLGDLDNYCEENMSHECYSSNSGCKCEDGWEGEGCCDKKKFNPAGIVVGSLTFLVILLLWIFRRQIRRYFCDDDEEQDRFRREQRERHQNSNHQRIHPQQPIEISDSSLIVGNKQKYVPKQMKAYSEAEKKVINSKDCAICLQRLIKDICVTPCMHIFHMKCIEQCILHQKQCPLDRLDLNLDQLILIL